MGWRTNIPKIPMGIFAKGSKIIKEAQSLKGRNGENVQFNSRIVMLHRSISIVFIIFVWTDEFVKNQSFKWRESLPDSVNSSIIGHLHQEHFFRTKPTIGIVFAWKSMFHGCPLQSISSSGRHSSNIFCFIFY